MAEAYVSEREIISGKRGLVNTEFEKDFGRRELHAWGLRISGEGPNINLMVPGRGFYDGVKSVEFSWPSGLDVLLRGAIVDIPKGLKFNGGAYVSADRMNESADEFYDRPLRVKDPNLVIYREGREPLVLKQVQGEVYLSSPRAFVEFE